MMKQSTHRQFKIRAKQARQIVAKRAAESTATHPEINTTGRQTIAPEIMLETAMAFPGKNADVGYKRHSMLTEQRRQPRNTRMDPCALRVRCGPLITGKTPNPNGIRFCITNPQTAITFNTTVQALQSADEIDTTAAASPLSAS